MASEPMSVSSSVRPSGADLATKSEPRLPVAPALFSTTMVAPSASAMRCDSRRARMSLVPPAALGTMIFTDLPLK